MFQIMDFYAASGLSLLWICFFETIAISWFYGVNRFARNIESMTGSKPHIFWYLCWACFAPLVMAVSTFMISENNKMSHCTIMLFSCMICFKIASFDLRVCLSTILSPMSQFSTESLENMNIQSGLRQWDCWSPSHLWFGFHCMPCTTPFMESCLTLMAQLQK